MTANRQTAVGAFVLGGIVLGLAAVVLFGKFNVFSTSIQAAVVFQKSIAGLSIGSPVTFQGVRVGAVQNIGIQFDPKTNIATIPVTVTLDPGRALIAPKQGEANIDLPDMISRGLRAELNVQSFVTGQSQIDLDFDPTSSPILHPAATSLTEIPTRQSTLQKAADQLSQLPLHELAENATATLQSLRGLAEKLDQDLPPLVQTLKVTSERSTQTLEAAVLAIQELQGRLDTTLGAIGQLAITGDKQLTQRGAELHTMLTSSNQSMLQVRDMIGDLKHLTSDRSASRANVEATLRDLAAAAASLRGFANDIEHDPGLLLTGRRP